MTMNHLIATLRDLTHPWPEDEVTSRHYDLARLLLNHAAETSTEGREGDVVWLYAKSQAEAQGVDLELWLWDFGALALNASSPGFATLYNLLHVERVAKVAHDRAVLGLATSAALCLDPSWSTFSNHVFMTLSHRVMLGHPRSGESHPDRCRRHFSTWADDLKLYFRTFIGHPDKRELEKRGESTDACLWSWLDWRDEPDLLDATIAIQTLHPTQGHHGLYTEIQHHGDYSVLWYDVRLRAHPERSLKPRLYQHLHTTRANYHPQPTRTNDAATP